MEGEEWLKWIEDRGRKPGTILLYKTELSTYLKIMRDNHLSTDPASITADTIISLKNLRSGMVAESSIRQGLWVLGRWVEFETGRNPFKEAGILWNRSESHPHRHRVSSSELELVDLNCDPETHLILTLGSCMGLRRSEISRLSLSDIKDGKLRILGKGHGIGKVEYMTIPPIVNEALERYFPIRAKILSSCDYDMTEDALLVTKAPGSSATRMQPYTVSRRVQVASESVGVTMSVHSLRRRFASNLDQRGVDLVDIKTLMRHEKIETTLIYLETDQCKLDKILMDARF